MEAVNRETSLRLRYFRWMTEKLGPRGEQYQSLLKRLDETCFYSRIEMDENRAGDGIDLRYRFGIETDTPKETIVALLDHRPCSVFEMMLALAIRCEEHIMHDPELDDRTDVWFFTMIDSLGLRDMTDESYCDEYAAGVIYNLLERRYHRNGQGGLFIIHDPKTDMTKVEIWYQMMRYLNEIT